MSIRWVHTKRVAEIVEHRNPGRRIRQVPVFYCIPVNNGKVYRGMGAKDKARREAALAGAA